ncbi:hypothetical protein ABEB36_012921 [Hypothenemus hampei]|uniref:Uncharacterized protein n=1 Tax=Hypothenemus hampei TaxID=57062 RepID=A0ABD1E685_HYPHA
MDNIQGEDDVAIEEGMEEKENQNPSQLITAEQEKMLQEHDALTEKHNHSLTELEATQVSRKKVFKKRKTDDLLQKTIADHEIRVKQRSEERKRLAQLRREQDTVGQNLKTDGLYNFFLSMFHVTRKLTKPAQLRLKKIFEAVLCEEGAPSSECTQSNNNHSNSLDTF